MVLTIVRDLIDRLNKEQILYCHWKSNQHVSNVFLGIDDIDMLISQKDIQALNIILNELGYKRFRLPEKKSYIGIEDFLGLDSDTGNLIHLHLHYQLTLGEKFLKGYQLPYSNSILNRRIFDTSNSIFITSHEDEMWLLIVRISLKLRHRDTLKSLIGKDVFGKSTIEEFDWLKQKMNLQTFKKQTKELFGKEVSIKMIEINNNGLSYSSIKKLSKQIKKIYQPLKSYTVLGGIITRWYREGYRIRQELHNNFYKGLKSYRRTPISGGKIIAFLGPDGAGKTTVISEVNKTLSKEMDVNKFYLGSGDGHSSLIRKPIKIIYSLLLQKGVLNRKSRRIDGIGNTSRRQESKIANFIRSIGQIPWAYTLAQERKNKILKSRKYRNKGFVVLTDRYPQSQIKNICDGPKYYVKNQSSNFKKIEKLVFKVEEKTYKLVDLVKPDIVIILRVSSDIAYDRKPDEIEIASHENLMKSILKLDFGEETEVEIINADKAIDYVVKEVLSVIWRHL